MAEAYIYDAVRTPRGKGKNTGTLHEITALQLATQALKAIKDRNGLDTSKVDDVILGCVSPVGEQGSDIARIAVLNADYAETTAGVQVDRFCASGLEACNIAAAKVMTGEADMAIGGGVESMSRVPMGSSGGAWATNPEIAMKSYFAPQGIGADLIATKYGFSRDDVDAFAVESQKRAARAWKEGRFKKSVVPVKDQLGVTILAHDETIRGDTTMQTLAALNPSFEQMGAMAFDDVVKQRYPEVEKINHVHHAGNSSGIVDGASAVLIGNKETGEALGLKPRARIKGFASIGSEPSIMLTGPSHPTDGCQQHRRRHQRYRCDGTG
jgi:acetyl-CoA C-acetyltransferase